MTSLETAFIRAAVSLACSVVICASIVVIGWAVPNLATERAPFTEARAIGEGFQWCFNGVFGNACWQ